MIDVIIPLSKDRIKEVHAPIRSLEEQTHSHLIFRIIIVINPDTHESPDVASRLPISIIYHAHASAAGARNAGLAVSTSPYVLFLDCDVELSPDWIENIYSFLEKNKIFAAAQGSIIPDISSLIGKSRWELKKSKLGDKLLASYNYQRINPLLDTASVLFRREAIREMQFNPAFERQEDLEFSTRLFILGHPFGYLTNVASKKNCHETLTNYLKKGLKDGFFVENLERSLGIKIPKWETFRKSLFRQNGTPLVVLMSQIYLSSNFVGSLWARIFPMISLPALNRNRPSKFLHQYLKHNSYSLNPFSRFIDVDGLIVFNNFFKIKTINDFNNLELSKEHSQEFRACLSNGNLSEESLNYFISKNILLKK